MTTTKPFRELTKQEATALAREIVNSSWSEDEIRRRLNETGFDGSAATIASTSHDGMFMAMVMVYGPQGETITV